MLLSSSALSHQQKISIRNAYFVLIHKSFPTSAFFLEKKNKRNAVEARRKDPVLIRTLKVKFYLLYPLNKNPKEAKIGNGSYIIGFTLFILRIQE